MKLNMEGISRDKEGTNAAREQDWRGCDILSVIQTGAGRSEPGLSGNDDLGAALHGSHHDGCVGGTPL